MNQLSFFIIVENILFYNIVVDSVDNGHARIWITFQLKSGYCA